MLSIETIQNTSKFMQSVCRANNQYDLGDGNGIWVVGVNKSNDRYQYSSWVDVKVACDGNTKIHRFIITDSGVECGSLQGGVFRDDADCGEEIVEIEFV